MNKLICGDNLEMLKTLEPNSVDLIFIDPPFFSNANYEVVWGDKAEVRSFSDRWQGGIEHYIAWMAERVQLLYDVLKPTGSMYLHCDKHANAHLRILMDKIFGANNFRNEIIWWYKRWSNVSKGFQQMHDNIYFYTKSKDYTFNIQYQEYSKPETIEKTVRAVIDGKLQRLKDKDGKYVQRKKENIGVAMHDVWELQHIQPTAKERLGYPTQKPEALLERIIKASSKEGDIVLDAFCGCGTALAVAQKLGRQWIGIDISPTAVKCVEKRLNTLGAKPEVDYVVIGLPTTVKELHKLEPFEFQNWVVQTMRAHQSLKKTGDMGLDGYIPDLPAGIQVKQSEHVGRNVVDNFRAALERAKYPKGYIVAFSFGSGAVEEASRLKNGNEIDIELLTVEDLLAGNIGHRGSDASVVQTKK